MAFSMYDASIPVFKQLLGSLSSVLDKGAAFAKAKSVEPAVLVGARLAPDMFPLSRQVQIATDMSKGAVCRLAGIEIPAYADDEKDFEELKARIARTLALMSGLSREQIDGSEEHPITLKLRRGDMHFTGASYLLHWAMPQFTFHCVTAYDILRHNGVEIGKQDFIGSF